MPNFRALARIHHKPEGKDAEEIKLHPGAVFRPDEVGMDRKEVRRLVDAGHLEETELDPWEDPTQLRPGSATVRGPYRPGAPLSGLITPTFPTAPAEPMPITTTEPAGDQPNVPQPRQVPSSKR